MDGKKWKLLMYKATFVRTSIFVTFFFFLFMFVSCSKEESNNTFLINIKPQKIESNIHTQSFSNDKILKYPGKNFQSIYTGGTIVVVCGFGYNDADTKNNIVQVLQSTFGLTTKDKSLLLLTYPFDFMRGDSARISLLVDKIEGVDVASLILLGSPTNTHKVLAYIQDNNYTYPVFSLFSQDDILGTEAGSTVVIDVPCANDNMLNEEQIGVFKGNVTDVIKPLVAGVLQGWKSFDNKKYLLYVSDEILTHTGYRLREYIDPETDIKSDNHYVLVG